VTGWPSSGRRWPGLASRRAASAASADSILAATSSGMVGSSSGRFLDAPSRQLTRAEVATADSGWLWPARGRSGLPEDRLSGVVSPWLPTRDALSAKPARVRSLSRRCGDQVEVSSRGRVRAWRAAACSIGDWPRCAARGAGGCALTGSATAGRGPVWKGPHCAAICRDRKADGARRLRLWPPVRSRAARR
jgi:hypothetical protein